MYMQNPELPVIFDLKNIGVFLDQNAYNNDWGRNQRKRHKEQLSVFPVR